MWDGEVVNFLHVGHRLGEGGGWMGTEEAGEGVYA